MENNPAQPDKTGTVRNSGAGNSREDPLSMIAVDMGASNIRVMIASLHRHDLRFREAHRFPNRIIERDGHERWDLDAILHGITSGIRKADELAETKPDSIGVDCWGVDFVLMDDSGAALEDPVAYRDKRTQGMEERWLSYMDREETFRRSGINFYIFNSLFQLLSLRESRRIRESSRILFMPSFILHALGGTACNEITISSTSQMLGAETGDWDPGILEGLGLEASLLSPICQPGTITGAFQYPGIELPGAKTVAVCAHDTASAVAATPFEDEDSVFISTGTWCIVGIESRVPILSREALDDGFTNERGYDGTFRFLKNIVGLWLVQGLIRSFSMDENYDMIEGMAERHEGEILLIDPEDPVFYNPENMKSAFDDFFGRTGQTIPADASAYFRCAYDSLVCSFRYHIEKLENMTGRQMRNIHMIGGGCQSAYLTRQTAAMCGRKVVRGPVEGATLGNLLVQAIAMGRISDIGEARGMVRDLPEISDLVPVPGTASGYDRTYQKFTGLQQS